MPRAWLHISTFREFSKRGSSCRLYLLCTLSEFSKRANSLSVRGCAVSVAVPNVFVIFARDTGGGKREEVLGLKHVGIHDTFFDLGGHSLTATQVTSRIVMEFKLELPIKFLPDSPTVAEMAAVIAQSQETLL